VGYARSLPVFELEPTPGSCRAGSSEVADIRHLDVDAITDIFQPLALQWLAHQS